VLKRFHLCVEARVDDEVLQLRKSFQVSGVERVDLRLDLGNRGFRFEPPDVLPVVAVI